RSSCLYRRPQPGRGHRPWDLAILETVPNHDLELNLDHPPTLAAGCIVKSLVQRVRRARVRGSGSRSGLTFPTELAVGGSRFFRSGRLKRSETVGRRPSMPENVIATLIQPQK